MFESSVACSGGGRTARPVTVSISMVAQLLAAAAAVTIPLYHIAPLPRLALRAAPRSFVRLVEPVVEPPEQRRQQPPPPANALTAPSGPPRRPVALLPRAGQLTVAANQPFFDAAPDLAMQSGVAAGTTIGGLSGGSLFGGTGSIAAARPESRAGANRPASQPSGPVRVGGQVSAPRLIAQVHPTYPPLARQTRIQGTVRIEAILARDGTVRDARVVAGHPLLVSAALEAVKHWRYQPTMLNGQPVEVALGIEVNFSLAPR